MSSVAVIIPCYRDSKTLARALDSVRAQTHRVDEIIVVNDDSPETAEIEKILQNYPEVIYKKNPHNQGLAATRNAGVHMSTSDIVSFLDADDQLHPQKIELQMAFCSGEVAITCGIDHVVADCQYAGRSAPRFEVLDVKKEYARKTRFIFRNSLTGAALMIRRNVFLRMGGYDSSLRSCEDFDLWLRLISAGIDVVFIKNPLYIYHYNPVGLSNNFRNISHWELVVLSKHLKEGILTSLVFGVWLAKHVVRAKLTHDTTLLGVTLKNARIHIRPYWISGLFVWLAKLLPMFVVALFFGRRNGC